MDILHTCCSVQPATRSFYALEQDSGANQRLYGKAVSAREIVLENAAKPTPAGQTLVSLLEGRS